jgi:hypothetical protein
MSPIPSRTTAVAAFPMTLWLLVAGCGSAPAPAAAPDPPQPTASAPAAAALPAVQAYVDAVNTTDLDALVAAFAPDGRVVDVSRRIDGADAIRSWADTEVIGGMLRVDGVTALDPATQRLRVHWAPSGSAGWAADYTFTTRGDEILVADLQYAR